MKSGGRVITIGSAVGERRRGRRACAIRGTKGDVKMFTQALAREIGGPRHHGQQTGSRAPIDTESESAGG